MVSETRGDDFLDYIFMAEEKQYSDAYREAFEMSKVGTASGLPDRSNQLHSTWIHGLQYGAQLGSELFSYLGLAEEVLASLPSEEAGSSVETMRKNHPLSIAKQLLCLLNDSPGPLSRSCEQFAKQPSFDTDLALIRSKAKRLISILNINAVSRRMDSLDF